MPETASPSQRFKELRERAGFSREEAASRMGISSPSVWDIEAFEDELTSCYSPSQVRRFCEAMSVRPVELFGVSTEPAVLAGELADRIRAECRKRNITLEQFEDAVGWKLSECLDPPERLLEDMTLDGMQWLCRELGIDWHRVIMGL
jgi:DNA-binding XRE family transcriptional regulator